MHEGNQSPIDKLREKIYSRQAEITDTRPHLHKETNEVPEEWSAPSINNEGRKNMSFLKKIFIGSAVFFVLAAALAALIYFGGFNLVSTDNIDIKIIGPIDSAGGESVTFEAIVQNRNNANLELANLYVNYPENTRDASDLGKELTRQSFPLGEIKSGDDFRKEISAVFFGEEHSVKEITFNLEYRVKGSNAIFSKEKRHHLVITSSPVAVNVVVPKESTSGQDVNIDVTVVSNSATVIENMMLKAEFPFGFEFKSSNPAHYLDKNLWKIGDLQPGGKYEMKLKGKIIGTDNEDRSFRFVSGVQSKKNPREIGTVFVSSVSTLTIKKPFISTDLIINGENAREYSVESGKPVRADIVWASNTNNPISNMAIEVKLEGEVLDKNSVSAEEGFYRSVENKITWDQSTLEEFALIQPNDTGRVSFQFMPNAALIFSGANPEVKITVNVRGKRENESGVPEELTGSLLSTVKITSDLRLAPRLLYSVGPFTNTGPFPTKADKQTTFTVVWTISSSLNNLRDVQVKANLPPYVKWLGAVSPNTEDVKFSEIGGEITWNAGVIKKSKEIGSVAKEVAFRVAFEPSLQQIGSAPIVIQGINMTAIDDWTSDRLRASFGVLNTRISTDPIYISGSENVQR